MFTQDLGETPIRRKRKKPTEMRKDRIEERAPFKQLEGLDVDIKEVPPFFFQNDKDEKASGRNSLVIKKAGDRFSRSHIGGRSRWAPPFPKCRGEWGKKVEQGTGRGK